MNKTFKIIYYVFIAFIGVIVLLLAVSIFPITGNIKFLVVQSGSMAPSIRGGSIVMIKPSEDYKIGEVITFGPYSKTQAPITHRIFDVRVTEGVVSYITKGDINNAPDKREIAQEEILGKVLLDIPFLGYAVDFAKKPLGFALIIIIPAVMVVIDEAKKIFKEIKKQKNIIDDA